MDCLRGLHYAMKLGWFNFKKFDIVEYEHYEKIENGDLNWIVPNKLVAFSSPYDKG
jgi:cell division cycle 14